MSLIIEVDATGLACPMPIIKLKKAIAEHAGQQREFVLSLSDSGGLKDVPAFCGQQGLAFELRQQEPVLIYRIWRE